MLFGKNDKGNVAGVGKKRDLDSYPFVSNDDFTKWLLGNMRVHVLRNGETGKVIKFYEMIHLATDTFYDSRNKMIMDDIADGFIIHHEGIHDIPDKYSSNLDYGRFASDIGLVAQKKPDYNFKNYDLSWYDLSFSEKQSLKFFLTMVGKIFDFALNASLKYLDRDVSGSVVGEAANIKSLYFRNVLIDTMMSDDGASETLSKYPFVRKIIVDKRNKILVDNALAESGNVSLVWGKEHFKDVFSSFKQAGFEQV